MQQWYPNDSKWDILKKLLLNQVENAGAVSTSLTSQASQLTQIFDRLFQFMEQLGPVNTFRSLANLVVAVAGTAVQGPDAVCKKGALISAFPDNTGNLYVGGAGVSRSTGTEYGMQLVQAGTTIFLPVANTNMIFVNADQSGDKCGIIAI